MSDPISRIGNIQPTYPVKPVQPSKKDRRSGRRRNPTPKDKSRNDPVESSDPGEEVNQSTIDEYI